MLSVCGGELHRDDGIYGWPMTDAPIKIGIMLDAMNGSAWVEKSISLLKALPFVQIDVIIVSGRTQSYGTDEPLPGAGWWRRVVGAVLKKIVRVRIDALPAYKSVDLSPLFIDVPRIQLNTEGMQSKEDARSCLAGRNLDIILGFGSAEPADSLYDYAKYGIWTYIFGDDKSCYGMPVGFWEVILDAPAIRSALVMQSSHFAGRRVLYQSYSPVDHWSVEQTNSQCLWRSATFPARVVKDYDIFGAQHFDHLPELSYTRNKAAASLSGMGGCGGLFNLVLHKVYSRNRERFYDLLYWEQWGLLYTLETESVRELNDYNRIVPPEDRFWADPFVIYRDGQYYIFVEEHITAREKAHISVIVMDETGRYENAGPVLERPYHLSYPHVFEYKGAFYMIPETSESQSIELYTSSDFPYKWEKVMNMKENVLAYDTTVFYRNNLWWMFANTTESRDQSSWDELSVFYADDLFSDCWKAHSKNPVVSDVRRSRPAGAVFEKEGRLYRPSQDCSRRYGYGVNINEITLLTEDDYHEQLVEEIKPADAGDIVATHTINRAHNMLVMDAQFRRRK